MPHTFTNGFGGSITFAQATLDVESWDLTITAEALDTTNTGDGGWESNILGCKAWEGSCKTWFDTAAVPTGAAGFIAGARGTFTFPVGESAKVYTGTAQITSIAIENAAKGAVTFNINFKGYGALTYAS